MDSQFDLQKYIDTKCLQYFKDVFMPAWDNMEFEKSKDLSALEDSAKCRIAWYFVALKAYLKINIHDTNIIQSIIKSNIIDTDFRGLFKTTQQSERSDDLGVDLVYIDDQGHTPIIHLMNFKFRTAVNRKKGQTPIVLQASTKFLTSMKLGNSRKQEGVVKDNLDRISELLDKQPVKVVLTYISNEQNSGIEKSEIADSLRQNYPGLEIKSIHVDNVIQKLLELSGINAKLFLTESSSIQSDLIQVKNDKNKAVKAEIVFLTLNLIELIKIVNADSEIRDHLKFDSSNFDVSSLKFEYSVLGKNIRHYLEESDINKETIEVLKNSPEYFLMFNNGVTIVCDFLKLTHCNMGKKVIFELFNLQLVNGGQTVRNIFKYIEQSEYSKDKLFNTLKNTYVSVRVIGTKDESIQYSIARYTNSQNSIKEYQLSALKASERLIEKELKDAGIYYHLKDGEIVNTDNNKQIERYELAQILLAISGNPHEATDSTESLLTNKYNEIFKDVENECIKYPNYIHIYFYIKEQQEEKILNNQYLKIDKEKRDSQTNKLLRGVVLHVMDSLRLYNKSLLELPFSEKNKHEIDDVISYFNHFILNIKDEDGIKFSMTRANDLLSKKEAFEQFKEELMTNNPDLTKLARWNKVNKVINKDKLNSNSN